MSAVFQEEDKNEKWKMVTDNGLGPESSLNDLCCGLGVYAISKNADTKSNSGHSSFFSNYRQHTFYDGLLCLQTQKLI